MLSLLDAWTTLVCLSAGGEEANPLMAMLLAHPVMFWVVKFMVAFLVTGAFWSCSYWNMKVPLACAIGVTILYTIAVVNNLLQL